MPRWAGPPPLLVAATVLGILVAPAVSRADADPGTRSAAAVVAGATPGTSGTTSSPVPSGLGTRDPRPGSAADLADPPAQVPTDVPTDTPTIPPVLPTDVPVPTEVPTTVPTLPDVGDLPLLG